jgi:uncharacterized membrane protein
MRGLVLESWTYHPMGLLILGLFAVIAAQSVCPRSFREWLARRMQQHAGVVGGVYVLFVVMFVSFGAVRAVVCAAVGSYP